MSAPQDDVLARAVAEHGPFPMPVGTGPAPMTPDHEQEIRADLAAVPAPPWRWIGLRGSGGPQLVTDHSGRQYLLRAAKPTDHRGDELLDPETDAVVYGDLEFRDQRRGETYSLMRSGNSLAVGRTEYDPDAIVGVANPLARWFEKSAQHATELLAEVDRLRAERTQLQDDITGACLARHEEELENARLRARIAELEAATEKVTAFCAQRAECITAILNCHPDNAHDYYRWQGHAESRRQLSERLGLPVAWPAETEPRTTPAPAEDPHDSPLHQTYALGHDLPEVSS